jgi:phospholipase/carboxylesterase
MKRMAKIIAAVMGVKDEAGVCPAEALWDLQKKLGVRTSLRSLMFDFNNIAPAAGLVTTAVIEAVNKNSFSPPIAELIETVPSLTDSIATMIAAAYLGRRPCARANHSLDPLKYCNTENQHCHSMLMPAIVGAPIEKASQVIICIHGRFASAEGIIHQLENIIGVQHSHSSKVTIIAPQAWSNSWYPVSFQQPQSVNQPNLGHCMDLIDSCVRYAGEYVSFDKVYLFGFSQGACAALSYAMQRKGSRLGGVFAFSGGLIGADEEINLENYCGDSIEGVRVLMGCADLDDHVPIGRIRVTCELLQAKGALLDCDIFSGSTEHKIFPLSAKKVAKAWTTISQQAKNVEDYTDDLMYLSGFGNALQSEALPGTVPGNQRFPTNPAYGLVAEVMTGSSFCAPRGVNFTTTFYRIHPSIGSHGAFTPYWHPHLRGDFCCRGDHYTPEPVRWAAIQPVDSASVDFIDGLKTIAGTGNPMSSKGVQLVYMIEIILFIEVRVLPL